MNAFQQAFHSKIQVLASLNESIVNSHFPSSSRPTTTLCKHITRPTLPADDSDSEVTSMPLARGPPTTKPKLPVELLELVMSNLSNRELIPVLQSNRSLYGVAIRLLYRTIHATQPAPFIVCMKNMLSKPHLCLHVRVLDLCLSASSTLTGNFYRLLQRFLQALSGLTSLALDLPKVTSPVWIFDGCMFSLRSLSTSMQCSADLARFLDTQPNIRALTLRGFQSDSTIPLDFSNGPTALLVPHRNFREFVVQPESLPRLAVFNAIHAGPPVVATVARGRPLSVASVPLFSGTALESLDALRGGSVPLRRLSVISFDPEAPSFIFEEVAKRFPALEALHVVVLLAEFNTELLMAACPHLELFKNLKYLTCVACSPEEAPLSEEKKVAQKWHQHCPTLQTIILPKGRVWFQTPAGTQKKTWACFEDDDDDSDGEPTGPPGNSASSGGGTVEQAVQTD